MILMRTRPSAATPAPARAATDATCALHAQPQASSRTSSGPARQRGAPASPACPPARPARPGTARRSAHRPPPAPAPREDRQPMPPPQPSPRASSLIPPAAPAGQGHQADGGTPCSHPRPARPAKSSVNCPGWPGQRTRSGLGSISGSADRATGDRERVEDGPGVHGADQGGQAGAAQHAGLGHVPGPFGLNDFDFSGVPLRSRRLRRSLRRPGAGWPSLRRTLTGLTAALTGRLKGGNPRWLS